MSKQKKTSATAAERLESFKAKQDLEASKSNRRKSDNRLAVLFSGAAVIVAIVSQLAYFSFGPGSITETAEPDPVESSSTVPSPDLAEARSWSGSMAVGDAKLEIKLDGKKAPQAVANFISLVNSGFYEGVSCHRLVTDGIYVLQCGDPQGDGRGGPGYKFGPIENAPAEDSYKTGLLAMARASGDGNSMGSQFFIVYDDSIIPSDAAGGYTVFGKVTKGLDQLNPIIEAGVSGGATDGPPALETILGAIELR